MKLKDLERLYMGTSNDLTLGEIYNGFNRLEGKKRNANQNWADAAFYYISRGVISKMIRFLRENKLEGKYDDFV